MAAGAGTRAGRDDDEAALLSVPELAVQPARKMVRAAKARAGDKGRMNSERRAEVDMKGGKAKYVGWRIADRG